MLSLHSLVACFALTGVGQTELLDFTAPWCGPCQQMQPIVDGLASQGLPVRKVNYDQERALVTRYNVTAIPCFVMLVDGKEVDRVVGGTTRARLEEMLKKASARAPLAARPGKNVTFADNAPPVTLRGQSPDAVQAVATTHLGAPHAPPAEPAMPAHISSDPLVTQPSTLGQGPHREALAAAGPEMAQNKQAAEKCLAASVRLKVEDPGGNSVGSGTIIDARDGEALVLTCGHIFRESKGKGSVYVDLFGPGAPKRLTAHLIGFDLKRDVGLVSFHTDAPVAAARLAPVDFKVKRGDLVISVGCDNGREPSVRASHVTNTDKFLPPPNIQVAGQPVEGRSGGGLFTSDGMVIGVCNAADPSDNEGLYAGVGSIYGELSRKGLTAVVAPSTTRTPASHEIPAMASAMPTPARPDQTPRAVLTSDTGPRGSLAGQIGAVALAPSGGTLVDKLRDAGGSAEVICIVRPLSDPHGMSEVLVVDHASPELLRQLAAEGHTKPARRLTSLETKSEPATRSRDELPTADSWQPNLGARRFR